MNVPPFGSVKVIVSVYGFSGDIDIVTFGGGGGGGGGGGRRRAEGRRRRRGRRRVLVSLQ